MYKKNNHCSQKVANRKGSLKKFMKKHSKTIFKYSFKILEFVKWGVDLYIKFKGL